MVQSLDIKRIKMVFGGNIIWQKCFDHLQQVCMKIDLMVL